MRKLFKVSIVLLGLILIVGCRSMGKSGKGSLVKVVAIEQNCPVEKVKILESFNRAGGGYFKLDACGKIVNYRKIGSVFMEREAAQKMTDSLSKQ